MTKPGFYVATTGQPDLTDMRQITGVTSSSPIRIYTVDNVIPLGIIGDDTEVFKLSTNINNLGLSCSTSSVAVVVTGGKCYSNYVDINCIFTKLCPKPLIVGHIINYFSSINIVVQDYVVIKTAITKDQELTIEFT